jgi:polyhydroxyalkanoate synthesis regulator phasin
MELSVETRLEKAEQSQEFLASVLKEIKDDNKETREELKKIGEIVSNQKLIMTKMDSIEDHHNKAIARTHERIDILEKSIKKVEQRGDEDMGCFAIKRLQREHEMDFSKMQLLQRDILSKYTEAIKHRDGREDELKYFILAGRYPGITLFILALSCTVYTLLMANNINPLSFLKFFL